METLGCGSWPSPWLTALPARSWAQVCAGHPAGAVPAEPPQGMPEGSLGLIFHGTGIPELLQAFSWK